MDQLDSNVQSPTVGSFTEHKTRIGHGVAVKVEF
jgi:hypothetical protein